MGTVGQTVVRKVVPTTQRVSTAPASKVAGRPVPSQAVTPATPGRASLSIASGVSKAQSVTSARKDIVLFNTNDLGQQYFRAMIYGPTNSRKTVTAAMFGTPEEVRIILTRRKEQMRPLEGLGYKGALVTTADQLESVLLHPESYWTDPTWVKNPNRTLIIDDVTEGIALLVDDNAVIDGREVKDPRRSYSAAGKTLRTWSQLALRADQHVIITALEKIKDTAAGEKVNPDIPPSMLGMLTTDLEYVFYIKTGLWKLLVDRKKETFTRLIEGKEDTLTRDIFAKNKQRIGADRKMIGNGIFGVDEPMDLQAIWRKICAARKGK